MLALYVSACQVPSLAASVQLHLRPHRNPLALRISRNGALLPPSYAPHIAALPLIQQLTLTQWSYWCESRVTKPLAYHSSCWTSSQSAWLRDQERGDCWVACSARSLFRWPTSSWQPQYDQIFLASPTCACPTLICRRPWAALQMSWNEIRGDPAPSLLNQTVAGTIAASKDCLPSFRTLLLSHLSSNDGVCLVMHSP